MEQTEASGGRYKREEADRMWLAKHSEKPKCYCIHPDAPTMPLPIFYARENILSEKDAVCVHCGGLCLKGVTRDRRSSKHVIISSNFLYCPHKGKALAIPRHSTDVCSKEIGGCGECVQVSDRPLEPAAAVMSPGY